MPIFDASPEDYDSVMDFLEDVDGLMYDGTAAPNVVRDFRRLLEAEVERGSIAAMRIKGYQCYEGTAAYEQSFVVARDMLTPVYEAEHDPIVANTLGYIYYHPRIDGRSDYVAAREFFMVAAACGIVEAQYKLADLFAHGYGVTRNLTAAQRLIDDLYDGELERFCSGNYQCKFADVALRRALVCEARSQEPALAWQQQMWRQNAYHFALQARYALSMRALRGGQFGDSKVMANIAELIERVYCEDLFGAPELSTDGKWIAMGQRQILANACSPLRQFQTKITERSKKRYKFRIRSVNATGKRTSVLVTIPELDYCQLHERVDIMATEVAYFDGVVGEKFLANLVVDPLECCGYEDDHDYSTRAIWAWGEPKASIAAKNLYLRINPLVTERGEIRLASVEFAPGGKLYDYILKNDKLAVGDTVNLKTPYGKATVTIKKIYTTTKDKLRLPLSMYKTIK